MNVIKVGISVERMPSEICFVSRFTITRQHKAVATWTARSLFLPASRGEGILHLTCHVTNFLYSWPAHGYEGSTDVKVLVGVLPKACCHLLSLLHCSAGYGYKVLGCKSGVLKHWGVSGFIECKSLLRDCCAKGSPLNPTRALFHKLSKPAHSLSSNRHWKQVTNDRTL